MDPSCVHELPAGGRVEQDGRITVNGETVWWPCSSNQGPGSSSGWLLAESENNPGYPAYFFSYLANSWNVPTPPTRQEDGGNGLQAIFLYNSLTYDFQQADGLIIQPVLQWGSYLTDTGQLLGGPYWIFTPHYVGANFDVYQTPIRVNPGDTLTGSIYWSCGAYVVTAQDGSQEAVMSASFPAIANVTAQSGVLEVNDLSSTFCSDLPASGSVSFGPTTAYLSALPPNNQCFTYYSGNGAWTPELYYQEHTYFPPCNYAISPGAYGAATFTWSTTP